MTDLFRLQSAAVSVEDIPYGRQASSEDQLMDRDDMNQIVRCTGATAYYVARL